MNRGQQMVLPVLAGSTVHSVDDATRDRILAGEFTQRFPTEYALANVRPTAAAAGAVSASNAHPNVLPPGFLNLSAPGAVVTQTINLLRAPVVGLAHNISLNNPAAVMSQNAGLTAPVVCVNQNTGLLVRGVGINHGNVPGAPAAHHIIARFSGGCISMDGNIPGVVMNNSTGAKASGGVASNSMRRKPHGSGVITNLGGKAAGPIVDHIINSAIPGSVMAHKTIAKTAGWQQGLTPPTNVQMGVSQTNTAYLNSSPSTQRLASLQGSPSGNGHLQTKQKLTVSTYLDDFKQGFPSKGLSVCQNRWWGNGGPSNFISSVTSKSSEKPTTDSSNIDDKSCSEIEGAILRPSPCDEFEVGVEQKAAASMMPCPKLSQLRKRMAGGGRRALKLGVTRGYGVQKLAQRDASKLQFIFGDSMPRQWLAGYSASN